MECKSNTGICTAEQRHQNLLYIIAVISMGTVIFEFIIYNEINPKIDSVLRCALYFLSSSILIIVAIIAFFTAPEGVNLYEPFDTVLRQIIKKFGRGRIVTTIYFAFQIGITLFIIQDGGAKASHISEILLLGSGFGYFFAEKKSIKRLVILSSILCYAICSFFHFNISGNRERDVFSTNFGGDALVAVAIVLFTVAANTIISSSAQKRNL